ARFFRLMQKDGGLPLTPGGLPHALDVLDRVIAEVSERFKEDLAPAIDRVWHDEIADLARDLHVWVRRAAADRNEWTPAHFEFAFGLKEDHTERDPDSVPDPVLVGGRFKLRGSVDLIEVRGARSEAGGARGEARGASRELRITDHKTGRNRTSWKTVIGGGS